MITSSLRSTWSRQASAPLACGAAAMVGSASVTRSKVGVGAAAPAAGAAVGRAPAAVGGWSTGDVADELVAWPPPQALNVMAAARTNRPKSLRICTVGCPFLDDWTVTWRRRWLLSELTTCDDRPLMSASQTDWCAIAYRSVVRTSAPHGAILGSIPDLTIACRRVRHAGHRAEIG